MLGLFPLANQGLLRDTQAMTAAEALHGPVESFLDVRASLEPDPSATEERPEPVARRGRVFTDERLVASLVNGPSLNCRPHASTNGQLRPSPAGPRAKSPGAIVVDSSQPRAIIEAEDIHTLESILTRHPERLCHGVLTTHLSDGRCRMAYDHRDPQSLHKYLYGDDDPINLVDPSGCRASALEVMTVVGMGTAFTAGSSYVFHKAKKNVYYGVFLGALASTSLGVTWFTDKKQFADAAKSAVFAASVTFAVEWLIDYFFPSQATQDIHERWWGYGADAIEAFAWAAFEDSILNRAFTPERAEWADRAETARMTASVALKFVVELGAH